jgi:hypothetical protein
MPCYSGMGFQLQSQLIKPYFSPSVMVDYTDEFLNTEPILHNWKNYNVAMVCNSSLNIARFNLLIFC